MAEHPYTPIDIDADHFKRLERYIVVLYDKTSQLKSVNEAGKELFCQRSKPMDGIPPTQDALLQHSKRAAYQTGIWAACDQPQQAASSPENWGWTKDETTRSWATL